MEAGTTAVLVLAAVFFGAIIWLAIHSRRQAEHQGPEPNNQAEEAAVSEPPSGK
jgi:preprotein translocase subunit SecG